MLGRRYDLIKSFTYGSTVCSLRRQSDSIFSTAGQQGFVELQTHAIAINSRKAKVLAAEYGKEADMQISANYLHHHRLVHCLDLPSGSRGHASERPLPR